MKRLIFYFNLLLMVFLLFAVLSVHAQSFPDSVVVNFNNRLPLTCDATNRLSILYYKKITDIGGASGLYKCVNGSYELYSAGGGASAVWGAISGTLSAQTDLQSVLNAKANLNHTHISADTIDFAEAVEDIMGNKIVAGSNVTISYNDATGQTLISASGGGSGVIDGNKGDITVTGSGATWTINNGLNAVKLSTGIVSNTELDHLDGVTSAIQPQINSKEGTIVAGTISQYWRGDKSFQLLDKTAVGLANVDNTADLNKPVSTATQTALNLKENLLTGGAAGSFTNANITVNSKGQVVAATNGSGGGGGSTLGGDVTGYSTDNKVVKIQNRNVTIPIGQTILDDFTGTVINTTLWDVVSNNSFNITQDGTLKVTATGSSGVSGGLVQAVGVDATGAEAQIDIVRNDCDGNTGFNCLFRFGITKDNGDNLYLQQRNIGCLCLTAQMTKGGVVTNSDMIFETGYEKYRLRHNPGGSTMYFETYKAGAWTTHFSFANTFSMNGAKYYVLQVSPSNVGTVLELDNFQTKLKADLGDKSLLWWNSNTGAYVPVQLSELKSALAAIP